MPNIKQKSAHGHSHDHNHDHTLYSELMCHLPYAIFSVAFCLTILSFLGYISLGVTDPKLLKKGAKTLFHSFHFLHIVFAGTGALITFFRFSKNIFKGLLVGFFCASVFCTLSDAIIPFLAGKLLGVHMHFHLCFLTELHNVLPFLVVGIVNGLVMGKYHTTNTGFYSIFSHFIHIFISSFASTFYLVSHGMSDWQSKIGVVFLFLVVAVVVPCTFSDVIIPMACAKLGDKKG